MFRLSLAEALHHTLEAVNQLPMAELMLWAAYFELKASSHH